jgi:hypothetical protein
MLLESVFTGNQTVNTFCDGIDYSPPKDAIDSTTFNSYFVGGSFPLTDQQPQEVEKESTQILGSIQNELSLGSSQIGEADGGAELMDAEKYSAAGSLNTCAQTAETWSSSPKSTYEGSPVARRGNRIEKKNSCISIQLSNECTARSRTTSQGDEKEVFLNSLLCTEIANQRVSKIALKMIDRLGFIGEEEWAQMTQADQLVLRFYVENIYSLHLTPNDGSDLLCQLNDIIAVEPKGKRNEEKLKKTVKKVNSMITRAFVSLNNLHHLDETILSEILFAAYFGGPQAGEGTVNIFANSLAFSQKAFSKIVENQRYAEDFATILHTSYVSEFIKNRQEKVLRSVSLIRKKLESNSENESGSLNDLIKRMPWQLSEIIDGAKLCHSIIEKNKSS